MHISVLIPNAHIPTLNKAICPQDKVILSCALIQGRFIDNNFLFKTNTSNFLATDIPIIIHK